MNSRMSARPATQANVELLRARGVAFVGPAEGELAEGEEGVGRMAEPEESTLVPRSSSPAGEAARARSRASACSSPREAAEPLDAVRYVGNRSSGRMGVAVAEEARRRGAEVTLLAANLAVSTPAGVTVVETPTAADLEREALARSDADVIVMAAAVADYRLPGPSNAKRPKDGSPWTLALEPTPDVLADSGPRGRTSRCSSVSQPMEQGPGSSVRARNAWPSAPTSSSSTTCRGRISASTLSRTRWCSSRPTASGRSRKLPRHHRRRGSRRDRAGTLEDMTEGMRPGRSSPLEWPPTSSSGSSRTSSSSFVRRARPSSSASSACSPRAT